MKKKLERFTLPCVLLFASAVSANAGLMITPSFDSSITGNSNAGMIESAVDSAIGAIDSLYSNDLGVTVTFTYDPAASGNLLSTDQYFYDVSYSDYVTLLAADAAANPTNTVLGSAVASLAAGNDAGGASDLAITGAQASLLGFTGASTDNAVININSNQAFAFSQPVPGNQYDLVGGLEHELDEVLGGGGAGSTLNSQAGSCTTDPGGFFCNKYGPLDLYRYSAALTASYTTDPSATAYLSVDGGLTSIAGFNQDSGGDYGDFSPPGSGFGQLIQNAFNTTGQDEAYTSGSPEFAMLESLGYNGATVSTPEPGTLALFCGGLALIVVRRRRRRNLQA